jgi:hypothetical protein
MGARLFTPSAARRSLEGIRPAAETMVRLFRAMEGKAPRVGGGDRPVDPDYYLMARGLASAMRRLREAGVRIEDPRTGTIAFPARREGRVVLLCWRVGEPSVGYWREVEVAPSGRNPVDEDGPWEVPGDAERE